MRVPAICIDLALPTSENGGALLNQTAPERYHESLELRAAYDKWWEEVLPATVENENAVGPPVNPFKELYWKQFGGKPDKKQ